MRTRSKGRGLVVSAISAFLAFGPMASAETLTDTLIYTYRNSPTLDINRAALRGLDEDVVQALSAKRLQVTANANATASASSTATRDITDTYSASLNASLLLYDGGESTAAVNAAAANIDSSRAQLANVEQGVLLDAITAYLDIQRDFRFVSLAENNVDVITQQFEAANDRFDVGEVTRTDVSQAESRLASARSNLAANRGALSRSIQTYIAVVGREPGRLAAPPAPPRLPSTLAQAQSIAVREHPTIKAAQAAIVAAEWGVERARAAKKGTISLNGSVSYSLNTPVFDDDQTSASVSLNGSVPIYDGDRSNSLVRQALTVLERRKAELQSAARDIKNATAISWTQYEVAQASIRASRQEIRAARVAFEGTQEEAKLGARTTLDVLDAEQVVLNAESSLASAERDSHAAAYNLISSMGLLTVDYLGLGIEQYDPDVYHHKVVGTPKTPTSRQGATLSRISDRWSN